MSKKLSLIFLLLGGILTIVGGTMLSIKDSKKDKEKSIEESKSLDEDSYMPIIYKISDKDNYIYLVPSFNHGDSNSKKISSKFYNILDKSTIIVEYDDTKTNQLDFDNNFILEEDDFLDNYITWEFRNKLMDFSTNNGKYNYDDYKHYNIGYNYKIINNIAYQEIDLTGVGIKDIILDKYSSSKKIVSIETDKEQIEEYNKPKGEEFIALIDNLIDKYDSIKEEYKNNYNNYINRDTKKLEEYYKKIDIENEYYNNKIVIRNDRIFSKILEYLGNKEKAVIVVDIDNVYGDNGLLRMLSDFKIELIKG